MRLATVTPVNHQFYINIPAELIGKELVISARIINKRKRYKKHSTAWEGVKNFYEQFSISVSDIKFDREELYDR